MAFHVRIQKNGVSHIILVGKRGLIIYLAALKKGTIRHAQPYYAIFRKLPPPPPMPPLPPNHRGQATELNLINVCVWLHKSPKIIWRHLAQRELQICFWPKRAATTGNVPSDMCAQGQEIQISLPIRMPRAGDSDQPAHSHSLIKIFTALRKHAYSNILKIPPPKTEVSDKISDIFHISAQNIDCGYSLEPPRLGGSYEYQQSMRLSRKKKNNVYPCKLPVLLYNYIDMFTWWGAFAIQWSSLCG